MGLPELTAKQTSSSASSSQQHPGVLQHARAPQHTCRLCRWPGKSTRSSQEPQAEPSSCSGASRLCSCQGGALPLMRSGSSG